MQKKGFTLIELMIVIAIIAILAAILVPNFLKARAQSQHIGCVHNIRNAAIAVEMYKTDCGEYPDVSNAPTLVVPNYMKTWPKCPTSNVALFYNRMDQYGSSYTKEEYCIGCYGNAHKEVGARSSCPQYANWVGWILK